MDTKMPIEELLYEEESATLDFKSEQYKFALADDRQKSELLKDILAFANSWRRVDAYILIGVKESKGGRSEPVGIHEDLDDAQLQQFINSKTQRPISFSYGTLLIDGLKVGFIKIPVQRRPIYLKSDYGKLKKHIVYIRRGSSTEEASPDEVHDMGRSEVVDVHDVPSLAFEFADYTKRLSAGGSMELNLVRLTVDPANEIPNYHDNLGYDFTRMVNSSYYRDLVKFYFTKKSSYPLSFLLRNDSNRTIFDIRVELMVRSNGRHFKFFRRLPSFPVSHHDRLHTPLMNQFAELGERVVDIEKIDSSFRIEIPFEKIQPKQVSYYSDAVYIQTLEDSVFDIDVTIYADNIPIPIKKSMQISCSVVVEDGSLDAIESMHTS